MKSFYSLFFILFISSSVFAQQGIKQFLDINKQATDNPAEAAFYRVINYTESGRPLGMVYDYYSSDKLQFEGMLSSVQPDVYEGNCVWYYQNGNKQRETYYLNGQPAGRMTEWNEDGKPLYEGTFRNGKQWGRHIFWDENGNFSEVAFYHDGEQISITELMSNAPDAPATDTRTTLNLLSEALNYRFLKDAADAYAFNNFGEIMYEQRKYAQALCLFFVSKEISEVLAMKNNLYEVNNNIAAAYHANGDEKMAEIYYKKAGQNPGITAVAASVPAKPKNRNEALAAYQESILQTQDLLKEKQQETPPPLVIVKDTKASDEKQVIISTEQLNSISKSISLTPPEPVNMVETVAHKEKYEPIKITETPATLETPQPIIIAETPATVEIPEPVIIAETPATVEIPEPVIIAETPATVGTPEPVIIAETPATVETPEPVIIAETPATVETPEPVIITETPATAKIVPEEKTLFTNTSTNKATIDKASPALIDNAQALKLNTQLPGAQQIIEGIEQYLSTKDKGALLQALSQQLGVNLGTLNTQDADAIGNVVEQLLSTGAYTGLTAAFDMGSATVKSNKNSEAQIAVLQGLGTAYYEQQLYPQALSAFEQVVKLSRNKAQLNTQNTAAMINMASVYSAKQDYLKAATVLEELKTSSEKTGDEVNLAVSHEALGKVNFEMGNYDAALQHFKQAAEYYESRANLSAKASACNQAANMLAIKGNYVAAENQYKIAQSLSERLLLNAQIAAIHNNKGFMRQMQGNYSDALSEYKMALALWEKEQNVAATLPVLINMAALSESMGNTNLAYEQYQNYCKLSTQLNATELADETQQLTIKEGDKVLLEMIPLAVRLSKPDEAFTLAAQYKNRVAKQLLTQPGNVICTPLTPALKAEEMYWQQSIGALQKQATMPQSISQKKQLQTTQSAMQAMFEQYKEKLTTQAPAYAQLKYGAAPNIEQIQETLKANEVLLNYAVTNERVYVFVIAKSVYQCFPLETAALLETEVLNFTQQYLQPSLEAVNKENKKTDKKIQEAFAQYAVKLYKKLLLPVKESGLINDKNLLIVPDGFLYALPFGMLLPDAQVEHQYKDYNYVARQYLISYYPSVSAFYQQRTTPAISETDGKNNILLLANASLPNSTPAATNNTGYFDMSTGKNIVALPQIAPADVKPLVASFEAANTMMLQQNQASEAKLKQQNLQKYRYLHISTPVLLNSQFPELSGIALSGSNALLTLPQIATLKPQAGLISLPYIYKQQPEQPYFTGNELFALQYGLMQSGTTASAMGLWALQSKDVNQFFGTFYEQLNSGKTKAEALQNTQLQYLQSDAFANPIYWAGFVLNGN